MSLASHELPPQNFYVRDPSGRVLRRGSPYFNLASVLMQQSQVLLVAYQLRDRRGRFFEEDVQERCAGLGIAPVDVSRRVNDLLAIGYIREVEPGHYSFDRGAIRRDVPAFQMQAGGKWFRNRLSQQNSAR